MKVLKKGFWDPKKSFNLTTPVKGKLLSHFSIVSQARLNIPRAVRALADATLTSCGLKIMN